ncbi:bifunctional 2-polyprenyl-6-hydroxyphenol methylase/3-demethylubiquinol 3-O-methyltransferase UbiG [Chroococcus sp. FPU101]|uniref:class I SAM-dependent methyltransferase n=1 Tax=Chroococcus sp. FPU101 TaxID=1974212 RepID=UPI001A8E550A|nr:methyltransferase domain-containing protein [Chroococcus sp. FPU101]GFE69739.1 unknown protein [Chroococcus sp. FPU101]
MPKTKAINISPETRYQNAAINYYLALTNSSYLHYGYWEPLPTSIDDLTIAKLRIAQEAYTAKLLDFIPKTVTTILDVGCGMGGNAAYLLERGFAVEGLAPDPLQQEQFLKRTNGQSIFHLTTFEAFKTTSCYDLILLSESSQYIAPVDIAQSALSLLNSGGYLLIADMMRHDANYKEGIFSNCHVITELQTALEEAGFISVRTEDISLQIAPTIDLCVDHFQRFGVSTFTYVGDLIAIAVPPLYKLLRWVYSRWGQHLVLEGLNSRQIFEKHLCYQIQLWQLPKSDQS